MSAEPGRAKDRARRIANAYVMREINDCAHTLLCLGQSNCQSADDPQIIHIANRLRDAVDVLRDVDRGAA